VANSRLQNLVAETELLIDGIDFTAELARYPLNAEYRSYLNADADSAHLYYKALAALVQVGKFSRVLEFGTHTGASAICLAKYAEEVMTCDLTFRKVQDPRIFHSNIVGRLLLTAEDCLRVSVQDFQFIFVDIDHAGALETKLHQKFVREFKGIVAYDDTTLNPAMCEFWSSIENPKIATTWHHTGFGLVAY
jgi:predicted O-methyltransferase YrrM